MTDEAVAFLDGIHSVVDAVSRSIGPSMDPADRPRLLYHFTDVRGLLGIIHSGTLWATLASSLNDASEIEHGLTRAREVLAAESQPERRDFAEKVGFFVDNPQATPRPASLLVRAMVVSLCEREDRAIHWLHYGRGGTGLALALDGVLRNEAFSIAKVLYKDDEQRALVACVFDAAWSAFLATRGRCSAQNAEALSVHSAAVVATHIGIAASLMKSAAFSDEMEWRFVTLVPAGDDVPADNAVKEGDILFREVGGRIAPYQCLRFERSSLREIVLGASAPMKTADPAFALLCQNYGMRLTIRRSSVRVRP
jgi:hypothetical protein